VPALGTAGLEHGTAGAGRHAGTETVLLGTATVVRLVGALHAALLHATHGGSQRVEIIATTRRNTPATPWAEAKPTVDRRGWQPPRVAPFGAVLHTC